MQGEDDILNLTDNPGRDIGPTISEDGWWIAFQSDRDGNWEIYTVDFFGRHQTRRTYNSANDTDPVWMPMCTDSTATCLTGTLAFQSDRTGNWDIFLLYTGTTDDPFQVTQDTGADTDPAWAPDGSALTFQSDRNGNWDVFTIDPDGMNETQWTEDEGNDQDPVWSPTGSVIAFTSDRNGNLDLYLIDLETGEEMQVTSDEGDDLLPAWSPNGEWLAFQSDRDGDWEIYAYELATGDLVRLTEDAAGDEAPSWDCDGTHVLFHSDRDGDAEVYAVALADPTDLTQFTVRDSAEQNVLWQPVSEDGSLMLEETAEEPEVEPEETECPECPEPTEPQQAPAGRNWTLIIVVGALLALAGLLIGWILGARGRSE